MKRNVAINELPVDLCMKVEKVARLEGVSEEEACLRILDSFFAEGLITTRKRNGVMLELALSAKNGPVSLFSDKVVIYPKEAAQ